MAGERLSPARRAGAMAEGALAAATVAARPTQALLCKSSSARPKHVRQLERWLQSRMEARKCTGTWVRIVIKVDCNGED
eukprot:14287329-Alexandrium_andersonii.AAC.1